MGWSTPGSFCVRSCHRRIDSDTHLVGLQAGRGAFGYTGRPRHRRVVVVQELRLAGQAAWNRLFDQEDLGTWLEDG